MKLMHLDACPFPQSRIMLFSNDPYQCNGWYMICNLPFKVTYRSCHMIITSLSKQCNYLIGSYQMLHVQGGILGCSSRELGRCFQRKIRVKCWRCRDVIVSDAWSFVYAWERAFSSSQVIFIIFLIYAQLLFSYAKIHFLICNTAFSLPILR